MSIADDKSYSDVSVSLDSRDDSKVSKKGSKPGHKDASRLYSKSL